MTCMVRPLRQFFDSEACVALVEVTDTRGSTPREAGAFMLVSPTTACGTIGGGQLEFIAIAKARLLLRGGEQSPIILDVPLGPEIGQCCGGRVEVAIRPVDASLMDNLLTRAKAQETMLPSIFVFGGGHVGQALASALVLLPARTVVIETRAEALEGMPAGVEARLTPMPEALVPTAPSGTAFVILTHDHALDFMICAEALKRTDSAYVGMIGSKTKKATFRNWFLKTAGGNAGAFAYLVSPIGGDRVRDKRPAVIAALVAAEIMGALVAYEAARASLRQGQTGRLDEARAVTAL